MVAKRIKHLVILTITCLLIILFAACAGGSFKSNYQYLDSVYKFDYVEIMRSDGTIIKGKVDAWKDYDNSDMIQVVINGITYYTHGSNVILVYMGE